MTTFQQTTITEQDSGKTLVYPETVRFQIELDPQTYLQEKFKLFCPHDGVLVSISNLPSLEVPRSVVRYQAGTPGTCTITNNDFTVTIQTTALPN